MTDKSLSRRTFLGGAAATALTCTLVPRPALGGAGRRAPSDVLTRATIGTGNMGMGHIVPNAEGGPLVQIAVCDADRTRLATGLRRAGGSCQAYTDWRRILDHRDIDVVHIVTPPHWHALMTLAAAKAGMDIYSEKPMTKFIREGQAIINAVHRYGRMIMYNTYGRGGWERFRKLVASGLLGTPLTVRLGPRQGYPFHVRGNMGETYLAPEPVPPDLDYEMWLGPAPFKPYNSRRVHYRFRNYWDYDGGGLTDFGQHWYDPIQYALGKDDTSPVEIEAAAPWPPHPEAVQVWGRIRYRYGDGTTVVFESGEWGELEPGGDAFFEGPRGKVYRGPTAQRLGRDTDPPDLWEQLGRFPDPPRLINFGEAVRTRSRAQGDHPNADEAHRSVSVLHLGNIAIRTGRRLRYDPVAQVFPGDEEANRLLDVPMRAPWHL